MRKSITDEQLRLLRMASPDLIVIGTNTDVRTLCSIDFLRWVTAHPNLFTGVLRSRYTLTSTGAAYLREGRRAGRRK